MASSQDSPQLSLSPLLFALEDKIENEDNDDGEHYDHGRSKPQDILHLQWKYQLEVPFQGRLYIHV